MKEMFNSNGQILIRCKDGNITQNNLGYAEFIDGTVLSWTELMDKTHGQEFEYNYELISNETIQDRAFANCDNLQNIVIPESVTDIGEEAFFGCRKILFSRESLRSILIL